ncbi:MAG: nucleoside-diphosphate-sugar epimerase [Paracoccaceae bacterium]|jgi:nucleoside-diphosphate-sugar epimerase
MSFHSNFQMQEPDMTQTVLILGASGRFGQNAANAFTQAGWTTRRYDRSQHNLAQAATGADVIVNALNPPYPDWEKQLPGLHAEVIAAARQTGATVIVPGNVYVFGQQTPGPWSETTPHNAKNMLGRLRIDIEAAYRRSGVQTIVLRAGDFVDTSASGNWFDQIMIKTLHKGVFTHPGNPDIPHAWAYLPDMCRAAVQLAEMRDGLPVFNDIPFAGYTASGNDIAAGLTRVTGRNMRVKPMSWLPIQLLRPFWRVAPRLLEMRYLWDTPHSLDNTLFDTLLPGFQTTPLETALASAIPQGSVQRQINPHKAVAAGG